MKENNHIRNHNYRKKIPKTKIKPRKILKFYIPSLRTFKKGVLVVKKLPI